MEQNNNWNFVKTYKLVQQTPLIHFQHNQSGATLRATEVKPKLDRFIMKKLGGKSKVEKKWLINGTDALNYKLQVEAIGDKSKTSEINEMYFGNKCSGKGDKKIVSEQYKETVFYEEGVHIKLICHIKELRECIADNIEEFFLVHNFGARQSKGFGGFTVEKTTDEKSTVAKSTVAKSTDETPIELQLLEKKGYLFFYAKVSVTDIKYSEMLDHAKNIYAVLKGGYNHTQWNEKEKKYKYETRYLKGYIQRKFIDDFYEDSKTIGSDKAYIKKYMKYYNDNKTNDNPQNRKGQEKEYNNYLFVRALLGLAGTYKFKDDSREGSVTISSLEKDPIERFKTPITIKIIDDCIVFLFEDFDKICGKTFMFASTAFDEKLLGQNDDNKKQKNNNKSIKITTPEKFDDKDKKKLIRCFVEYFNKERETLKGFNNKINTSCNIELKLPKTVDDKINDSKRRII